MHGSVPGVKQPPKMTSGKTITKTSKKPKKNEILQAGQSIMKPPKVTMKPNRGIGALQSVTSSMAGGTGKTRGGRRM